MGKNMKRKNEKKSILNKKRRKKLFLRRATMLVVFFGVIFSIIFGFIKLLDLVLFTKEIYVQSNDYYESEKIIEASNLKNGENLLFLNTSEIEEKICKKLPYIESAKVLKKFPNTIEIKTTVLSPKFSLLYQECYFILNKNHKLLEKNEQNMESLPAVLGVEFFISEDEKIIYQDLEKKEILDLILNTFENNNLNLVSQIDISDKNSIKIIYADNIKLILGDKKEFDYKVQTAYEIITNKIKPDEKGTLDLSNLSENNRSYFFLEK